MNSITDQVLKEFLISKTKNMPESKARKVLVQCIDDHGYIIQKGSDNDEPEISGITFTQIFIEPGTKLAEIATRGISYDETQYSKVREKLDCVLSKLTQEYNDIDVDNVLKTSMNIYLNIMLYYKDNKLGFQMNKGSLKRGYIFLCLWYSLVYHRYQIERDSIVCMSDIQYRDIPEAEKNIKRLFENNPKYSFIYSENGDCLGLFDILLKSCNGKKMVELVKEYQSRFPKSKQYTYAIVYYLYNQHFDSRVKITRDNSEQFVTYDFLNTFCGSFASQTIRKLITQIKS